MIFFLLIYGEDASWDFGVGAGFYVDATVDPWSKHYRMSVSFLSFPLSLSLSLHRNNFLFPFPFSVFIFPFSLYRVLIMLKGILSLPKSSVSTWRRISPSMEPE